MTGSTRKKVFTDTKKLDSMSVHSSDDDAGELIEVDESGPATVIRRLSKGIALGKRIGVTAFVMKRRVVKRTPRHPEQLTRNGSCRLPQ